MNNLEQIENYLNGQLSPGEREAFEKALRTDPELADTLAFYLVTRQAAREEAANQRKTEWQARRTARHGSARRGNARDALQTTVRPFRQWPYAVAAGLALLLGIGWYWQRGPSETDLADQYINEKFSQLPLSMSAVGDSIQLGLRYYNDGKLTEAGTVFDQILRRNPNATDALKWAGLVSLRAGQYDQAVEQFHRLGRRTDLYANPGVFYEAVARLKRDQPGDADTARQLLTQVVEANLEGKADAQALLNQLN